MKPLYPTCPVLCSDALLSDAQYYKITRSIFPCVMLKFRVHANLPIRAASVYVKDTKALSGNSLRYPKMAKAYQDASAIPIHKGIFSKYGARFNIQQYIPVLPPYLLTFVSLHLTTSTWNSYKTSWSAYFDFIKHRGIKVCLPASSHLLHSFAHYLYVWRNLKSSTIKSYLSGLKKLHELNYRSTHCFDDPLLASYLTGIENYEALTDNNPFCRNVITFPILQLWGHVIFTSNLNEFDRTVLWTVSLIAWWLARRMGELVSVQGSTVDLIRALTWSKVKIRDSSHFTVLIVRPKVTDKASPVGQVLDLWAYPDDNRYCPIFFLNRLHDLYWSQGKGKDEDLIFQWSSGVPVTLAAINTYLANLLTPKFNNPAVKFTCHSFRAGLPSMMATNPELFSEEDCRISGGWQSDVVRRYTRQHGIAQGRVIKKFQRFLKK